MEFIPYGRQDIRNDDVEAVVSVLRSDWLTQGSVVPRFEAALAGYCGAQFAVAVNSATSALHIACVGLGLQPGDWLWTSPNTFVASANCGLYCGANVDFVDIDERTYNMCADALVLKLEQAEREGRLPKVVVPVHFGGQSCDMRRIKALAERYGFAVVEDASHAIGAKYDGEPVGSCRYSDAAVFSFHPVKIITTGEGGAVLTNDKAFAECLARLRSHGMTRDPSQMEGQCEGPWYYEMLEVGWNYRMTDIQAALGESQLKRADAIVRRRTELADRYDELLGNIGLTLPERDARCASSWHLYVVGWTAPGATMSRAEAFDALRASGIGVNVHYIPVHLQPVYRRMGFRLGQFPNAERYYTQAITLPLHPGMSEAQQDRIVDVLRGLANAAARAAKMPAATSLGNR